MCPTTPHLFAFRLSPSRPLLPLFCLCLDIVHLQTNHATVYTNRCLEQYLRKRIDFTLARKELKQGRSWLRNERGRENFRKQMNDELTPPPKPAKPTTAPPPLKPTKPTDLVPIGVAKRPTNDNTETTSEIPLGEDLRMGLKRAATATARASMAVGSFVKKIAEIATSGEDAGTHHSTPSNSRHSRTSRPSERFSKRANLDDVGSLIPMDAFAQTIDDQHRPVSFQLAPSLPPPPPPPPQQQQPLITAIVAGSRGSNSLTERSKSSRISQVRKTADLTTLVPGAPAPPPPISLIESENPTFARVSQKPPKPDASTKPELIDLNDNKAAHRPSSKVESQNPIFVRVMEEGGGGSSLSNVAPAKPPKPETSSKPDTNIMERDKNLTPPDKPPKKTRDVERVAEDSKKTTTTRSRSATPPPNKPPKPQAIEPIASTARTISTTTTTPGVQSVRNLVVSTSIAALEKWDELSEKARIAWKEKFSLSATATKNNDEEQPATSATATDGKLSKHQSMPILDDDDPELGKPTKMVKKIEGSNPAANDDDVVGVDDDESDDAATTTTAPPILDESSSYARWQLQRGLKPKEGISWEGDQKRAPFLYMVVFVTGIVLFAEIGNNGFQIENFANNPTFGPSRTVLLNMGAKRADLILDGEFYRFIAAWWLHAGILHWLINIIAILNLANIEREFGTPKIALIYCCSGMAGVLTSCVFVPQFVGVGASGAVFGLIGAAWADLIQNWGIYKSRREHKRTLKSLIFVSLLNFLLGLIPIIDQFAHLGGFFQGLFMGLYLLLQKRYTRSGKLKEFRDKHVYLKFLGLSVAIVGPIMMLVVFYQAINPKNGWCEWCMYLTCAPIDALWICDASGCSDDPAVKGWTYPNGTLAVTCPSFIGTTVTGTFQIQEGSSSSSWSLATMADVIHLCQTKCFLHGGGT